MKEKKRTYHNSKHPQPPPPPPRPRNKRIRNKPVNKHGNQKWRAQHVAPKRPPLQCRQIPHNNITQQIQPGFSESCEAYSDGVGGYVCAACCDGEADCVEDQDDEVGGWARGYVGEFAYEGFLSKSEVSNSPLNFFAAPSLHTETALII